MRQIVLARLDKTRPAVVLTRELMRAHLSKVTVAPITGTIRGTSTEVAVGVENGLDRASVVSCGNVATVLASDLGAHLGYLLPDQESALAEAIRIAYDLE